MPCYHPLTAFRSAEVNPETGKRGLTFNSKAALIEGGMVRLPCSQCIGCRTDRARNWAIRCHHEAKLYQDNCFVTLTYDDQHVPADFSVKLRDWQLFMMRLRKRFGAGIRFLGTGEYGEGTLRPHYHCLLFNFDFPDKKLYSNRNGYRVFTSEVLRELWPYGLHEIGSVTMESSGYVARYCLKKITGDRADDHYWRRSPIDGEMHRVSEEFCTMSRRPGLGSAWFDKFAGDAFPSDFLIADGRKVKPPPFYLRKLDERSQDQVKRRRKRFAVQPHVRAEASPERRRVREEVHASRLKRLKREL